MPSVPSEISAAVRALRTALGESQQAFAYRMKTAVRSIARYETIRPPKGQMLAAFLDLAVAAGEWGLAKTFRKALFDEIHRTYLMRKGDSFRVGWCKLIRADGSCHLAVRAHLERADAAWILRICDSRSEASLWESYIAAEYGICTAVCRPMHDQCRGHYTPEVITKLFDMLGNQADRAERCLTAFGRDLTLPFYEHGKGNRYGAKTNKTAACNLIPGVMALPVVERPGHSGVSWRPVSKIERFPYDGCVHGLSVPPHHSYIADGIVTHNCIYGFTGAQPEAILHPDIPEDHKIVLKQSYRVPRSVHALAERTIHQVTIRQAKVYLPRPEDGHVSKLAAGGCNSTEYGILKTAEGHMAQGRTVMFLASCSYMLKPLIQVLRKHGIPFHNPYRRSNGFWNPIRMGKRTSTPHRILALLVAHPDFGEYHRPWMQGDVAMWADWLASKGLLRHGAKKMLQQADAERVAGLEYLDRIFEAGALDSLMEAWEGDYRGLLQWWRDRLTVDAAKRSEFPAEIAARYGPQSLMETPKIVVGTIHSVKGGQADCVFLVPDLSRAGD
jgi:transcriptional regulator with XRE-family HTH domain